MVFRGAIANVAAAQQIQRVRQDLNNIITALRELNKVDEEILEVLRGKS